MGIGGRETRRTDEFVGSSMIANEIPFLVSRAE